MAANVRLLLLLAAGCASTPTLLSPTGAEPPEVTDFKARFPEFYKEAHARVNGEFHAAEVAEKSQLGPGRWRVLIRLDLDLSGDNYGCRLLRSSGFNALDAEAVAACKRVKQHLFPPEASIDEDMLVHVPVLLTFDR
jgi:TonB family protein